VDKLCSVPTIPQSRDEDDFKYQIKKKWMELNAKIFDKLKIRKLRFAILNDDFQEVYHLINEYERISGIGRFTTNIKRYAIFNIINNNFINKHLIDKKI